MKRANQRENYESSRLLWEEEECSCLGISFTFHISKMERPDRVSMITIHSRVQLHQEPKKQ